MEELISLYMGYFGCEPDRVGKIMGSASNRSYYRMCSPKGTCIGVNGLDRMENEAFLKIAGHFRSKGLPVPEVYAVSEDKMSYIQEDLGRVLLYELVDGVRKKGAQAPVSEQELEDILCRTISILPKLQFEGADGLDFSVCYPQPAFDRGMVMFDLNYFKYCFLKTSGLEFNEVMLQKDFERFADDLMESEDDSATFLYRDFTARNVMVRDGEPYFIDFQGGRRGPVYYDLASFVWQARAAYPDGLKDRLVDTFIASLRKYRDVDEIEFNARLRLFVLFRYLQVLGAYGFRGWTEHKAQFVVSIPLALASLRKLISEPFRGMMPETLNERYPYLMKTLERMMDLERFQDRPADDGVLQVTVQSFSFKKGYPYDPSGNGGGYVFDCRSIHNPGRYEQYKMLTGMDEPVIRFLEEDGEILGFLEHVYGVVDHHVETFKGRGFTNLMVSFGCTGGQHRSVYCAEHLAAHLQDKYKDIRIKLIHREQGIERKIGKQA
jgi:aminoglycoside/choline kinase family phosphotransferase